MIQRCRNSRHKNFSQYGGRGITVCDRWSTFSNFLHDMGERPEDKTLDRIDVDGNYEPGNCRWATAKESKWPIGVPSPHDLDQVEQLLDG